jgi:hypothetical protein
MKDNSLDTDHLKAADLTISDFRDIVLILECATGHLLLPDKAVAAMHRLLEKAIQAR